MICWQRFSNIFPILHLRIDFEHIILEEGEKIGKGLDRFQVHSNAHLLLVFEPETKIHSNFLQFPKLCELQITRNLFR